MFLDPDGDWTWTAIAGITETLSVKLVDSNMEQLRHLGDAAKVIYADYDDGGDWINFASTAITEPTPTGQSTGEDGHLRFSWPGGPGTFTIRFRFQGDAYYNGTSQGATLRIIRTSGSVFMFR